MLGNSRQMGRELPRDRLVGEGLTEAEVLQVPGEPIERELPPVHSEGISQEEWDNLSASEKQWYQNEVLAGTCYGRVLRQSDPSHPP